MAIYGLIFLTVFFGSQPTTLPELSLIAFVGAVVLAFYFMPKFEHYTVTNKRILISRPWWALGGTDIRFETIKAVKPTDFFGTGSIFVEIKARWLRSHLHSVNWHIFIFKFEGYLLRSLPERDAVMALLQEIWDGTKPPVPVKPIKPFVKSRWDAGYSPEPSVRPDEIARKLEALRENPN